MNLIPFRSLKKKSRLLAESSKCLTFLWTSKVPLNHEEVGVVAGATEEAVAGEVAVEEVVEEDLVAVLMAVKVLIMT